MISPDIRADLRVMHVASTHAIAHAYAHAYAHAHAHAHAHNPMDPNSRNHLSNPNDSETALRAACPVPRLSGGCARRSIQFTRV